VWTFPHTYNGIQESKNADGSITLNGTVTDSEFLFPDGEQKSIPNQNIYKDLKPSTSYTFTTGITNSKIILQWFYRVEGTSGWIMGEQAINTLTFTTPSTYSAIWVRIKVAGGENLNNIKIYPMIRLSTETDPTFAPYSNICPISGHTGVNAFVRGKNQLDISNAVNATNVVDSVETDGTIHFKDVTAQWSNTHVGKIYVVKGQTYVISASNIQYGRFGFSTSPTEYPSSSTTPNITVNGGISPYWVISRVPTTRKFVANFTGYIYLFYCSDVNYDNYHATFATQIQIELGETATTYEPYNPNSQTIQVSWQTEAGEVFGGYVDLVSGVLTVTHKSQTGFTRGSQDSSNKLYNIGSIADIKKFPYGSSISPYIINSMFEKMSLAGAREAETPSIVQHITTLYVGGYIGKETELDTLLETLQVKYELATPITYQLTPTQIKSLLDNNNAWCDTGDIKSLQYQPNNIIAELRTEILALQARVEELEQTE
jgi:hypothetical protein